jgi:hypothetical protein
MYYSAVELCSHSCTKQSWRVHLTECCRTFRSLRVFLPYLWVPGTFLGVKAAGAWSWQPHHFRVPNVMKSGNLKLLEFSVSHRAGYGTPLPFTFTFCHIYQSCKPLPVAARSKAYVCGRSPAEIVGSNPTVDMDASLLWVLCVVR